jgi:hypothetical protein
VGGVLHDIEAVAPGNVENVVHLAGLPAEMHR